MPLSFWNHPTSTAIHPPSRDCQRRDQSAVVSTSTFVHFKYLWLIADEASRRAERFETEHTPADFGQGLVAVVFAAAAVEAYINEATHLIEQDIDVYTDAAQYGWLVDFAGQMTKAVAGRRSLAGKYLLASKLLGQPFNKEHEPFLSLTALIDTRNWLVHLTPTPPPAIANLEQLGIAAKRGTFRNYRGEDEPVGSQVDALANAQVAKWACDAAVTIIVAVMDMFPAAAPASLQLLRVGFPPP